MILEIIRDKKNTLIWYDFNSNFSCFVVGSCAQVHLQADYYGIASPPLRADKKRKIQFVPNGCDLAVAKHSIVFR